MRPRRTPVCARAHIRATGCFNGPVDDPRAKEPPLKISGEADLYNHRDGNEDYSQAGDLYRLMNADQKAQLVGNLVGALKSVPRFIQLGQIEHFCKADPEYGRRVADGLTPQVEGAIGRAA